MQVQVTTRKVAGGKRGDIITVDPATGNALIAGRLAILAADAIEEPAASEDSEVENDDADGSVKSASRRGKPNEDL